MQLLLCYERWGEQVDDLIGNAARLGAEQDALLPVQLADHKKILPPMRLETRKACPGCDQSVYGIKFLFK